MRFNVTATVKRSSYWYNYYILNFLKKKLDKRWENKFPQMPGLTHIEFVMRAAALFFPSDFFWCSFSRLDNQQLDGRDAPVWHPGDATAAEPAPELDTVVRQALDQPAHG